METKMYHTLIYKLCVEPVLKQSTCLYMWPGFVSTTTNVLNCSLVFFFNMKIHLLELKIKMCSFTFLTLLYCSSNFFSFINCIVYASGWSGICTFSIWRFTNIDTCLVDIFLVFFVVFTFSAIFDSSGLICVLNFSAVFRYNLLCDVSIRAKFGGIKNLGWLEVSLDLQYLLLYYYHI